MEIKAWIIQALLLSLFLAGCASGDDLRIVHPVVWHEVDSVELAIVCQDLDPKIRGCVVSRFDGDHIYVKKP